MLPTCGYLVAPLNGIKRNKQGKYRCLHRISVPVGNFHIVICGSTERFLDVALGRSIGERVVVVAIAE